MIHFEIRVADLAATSWPGNNHAAVALGYIDPRTIIGRPLL